MVHIFKNPLRPQTLAWRMLLGGAIALFLMGLFLAGVDDPDPAWPQYWQVRPLVITPLAAACGGACYYFIHDHVPRTGWANLVTMVLGVLVFVVSLWLGSVLGLDGTLWD